MAVKSTCPFAQNWETMTVASTAEALEIRRVLTERPSARVLLLGGHVLPR
jgi:hypothetical protein